MNKIWIRYKLYLEKNYLASFTNKPEDIRYWRAKLFTSFMLYILPLGIIVYIPSVAMSIISKLPSIAIIDTLVLFVAFLLVFNQKIKLERKKIILSVCLYILSIFLLIFLGSIGPGLIYLLATSILIVLIISSKAGYISIAVNLGIYCLLAIGLLFPESGIIFFNNYSIGSWIAVGSNFLLINTITVFTISMLITGLQKTILKEKMLRFKLKEESIKLEAAKNRAIESDNLKSAFLANMSHELRTPLNAIVGFANLLHKKKGSKSQDLFIEIINQSSRQLLTLINDIIDLSKIEAGVINIQEEKIKLIEFAYTIIGQMSSLCPKNLKFDFYLPPSIKDEEIVIDAQKVTQIITNLITNSYKYTKEGSVKLNIQLSEDKNSILFSVADTGIGIAAERHKYIFDRFYQENDIRSGVGLGLAICKSLVKAMNGKISFESEEGKGTTFFVTIPNNIFRNKHLTLHKTYKPQENKELPEKLNILIVEDDESNFTILHEILNDGKNVITRALDGYEALSQTKDSNFDLILMDIKMPNMDGLEATKQIRRFDKKTPIIAITAYAFDSDEKRALQAGCSDYLSKPIDSERLHELLSKHTNIAKS